MEEFYGLYSNVIADRKKVRDGRHLMKGDSGFDLYLPRDVEIQPGKIEIIDMNVKIAFLRIFRRYRVMTPVLEQNY